MENIIKIPSQQSSFNGTNNLVDIVIPGNSGVYDLSAMYVSIDTRLNVPTTAAGGDRAPQGAGYVEASEAVQNVIMDIRHGPGAAASIYDKTACPVEILVRNCSLMSASRGKVEDIRRSDRLRATMKSYLQDLDDVQSAALTNFTPGAAKSNIFALGPHAQLFGEGSVLSRRQTHEIRIYLRDLFEIAKTDAWDSAVYGNTHIHLELNLSDIYLRQDLGDTLSAVQGGQVWTRKYHNPYSVGAAGEPQVTFGKSDPVVYAAGAGAGPTDPANSVQTGVTMSAVYQSLNDSPFWVGQMLSLSLVASAGSAGTATSVPALASGKKWGVVKSIVHDPVTKKITLDFGAAISTVTQVANPGAGGYISEMEVSGWDADITNSTIEYDTIELTAIRRTDMDSGPKQIQYNQFMVQSDQWSSGTTLNRSYFLPPRTSTAIIVLPNTDGDGSKFLGSQRLSNYRFTVNGESVTNRAVNYMPQADLNPATANAKAEAGSALHYDMISNSMMNMGVRYSSLQECVYDQSITDVNTPPTANAGLIGYATLGACPRKRSYMLALPIPESDSQTQLTVELEGVFAADTGALELYSYVTSSI